MATRAKTITSAEDLSWAYRETALLLGGDAPLLDLVMAVGSTLGLHPEQMRRLEFGALLHDVGMVGAPAEILNKDDPLTPEERTMIEQHPVVGQAMLENVGGVLGEVGLIVRSTHERYDGTGYPDALAGEAIPIESRIIACANAFNAMTSDRPYRAALPIEEALNRLRRHQGKQFDAAVVDAVIAVVSRRQ